MSFAQDSIRALKVLHAFINNEDFSSIQEDTVKQNGRFTQLERMRRCKGLEESRTTTCLARELCEEPLKEFSQCRKNTGTSCRAEYEVVIQCTQDSVKDILNSAYDNFPRPI